MLRRRPSDSSRGLCPGQLGSLLGSRTVVGPLGFPPRRDAEALALVLVGRESLKKHYQVLWTLSLNLWHR
jgi:hypothetical protein